MNEKILNELADKSAIRRIIDLYANYADTKELDKQVALFSDDCCVETCFDPASETPSQVIKGKVNLKNLIHETLSSFAKTMHFNGQSIIELKNENEAEGIVYCRAYHQSKQNEVEKYMIAPIRYLDKYKKVDGNWYFFERKLLVQWRENR